MATALDNKLLPLIKRLIQKYGKTLTVKRFGSLAHDAATLSITEGAATTYSVKSTPPEPYNDRLVDGDRIMEGDTKTYLHAKDLSFEPTTDDEVVIDSETWKIMSVANLYTGDQVGAYALQLRK